MSAVVVYGATGHTGRFIVAELLERGVATVISGRDAGQLELLAAGWDEVAVRPAAVDDPGSLDRALAGAAAVVNCAGPFAVTGGPVVEAALRAGIPYVDVAAEIEANVSMFADYSEAARRTWRWCRRWPSTVDWATCWSPPPWGIGPLRTRRMSRTG